MFAAVKRKFFAWHFSIGSNGIFFINKAVRRPRNVEDGVHGWHLVDKFDVM